MTINIKNIINIIAKKVKEADSDEAAFLLSSYLNVTQRQGKGQVREYDANPGLPLVYVLPGSPASATSQDRDRLAYQNNSLYVRKNAGWYGRFIPPFVGQTAAYWLGGGAAATGDRISKLDIASGTLSTPTVNPYGTLATAKYRAAGMSSETNGYVAGGADSPFATAQKFLFSSGSSSVISGIGIDVLDAEGTSSIPNGFGFLSAGLEANASPTGQTKQKIAFSTDTFSAAGTLRTPIVETVGTAYSDNDGYEFGGVVIPGATPAITTIEKYPFATAADNQTAITTTLSTAARQVAGTQSIDGYAYVWGGTLPLSATLIDKISRFPFANDAPVAIDIGTISTGVAGYNPLVSSGTRTLLPGLTRGYVNQSYNSPTAVTNIDEFAWSSSVTTTQVASLNYNIGPASARAAGAQSS